ncbi:MAG: SDR family NAD(P)-dependent oxidoreductase [Kofleriaceae bacterium]
MTKPVCAVVGVGPGNGAAFARRFAADGYAVAMLARGDTLSKQLAGELPDARAFTCDVGDPVSVKTAFAAIRAELGDPEVVVYNAGSGVFATFDNVDATQFESAWRVNTLGAFAVAKEVIPAMERAGKGALIFVGATASRRGMPRTVVFAPAKAAQRSFAEALARTYGPKGIHVALIVIDGVVDLERTRKMLPDKPDTFFVKPDDVAATAAMLAGQAKSAWTFELEARPFSETW